MFSLVNSLFDAQSIFKYSGRIEDHKCFKYRRKSQRLSWNWKHHWFAPHEVFSTPWKAGSWCLPNLAQTLAGGRAEPPCSIKTASGEEVKLRMRTALAPAEGCVLTPGWGSCAMPGFSLWSGRLHLSVSTKIVDRLLLFRKASVFSQLSFSRATST